MATIERWRPTGWTPVETVGMLAGRAGASTGVLAGRAGASTGVLAGRDWGSTGEAGPDTCWTPRLTTSRLAGRARATTGEMGSLPFEVLLRIAVGRFLRGRPRPC